jgi:DNA excision repair protein ERCC-4
VNSTLPRNGKRPKGKLATQLYILQGLPNVGPHKARLLLNTFGSVEAVMRASEESLMAVNGIGSTTAKGILWAISEPSSMDN